MHLWLFKVLLTEEAHSSKDQSPLKQVNICGLKQLIYFLPPA